MYYLEEANSSCIKVNADCYIPFEPKKKTAIQLKDAIQKALKGLSMDENKRILCASYQEAEQKSKKHGYDLENRLFYNIGSGTFSQIFQEFPKEAVFQIMTSPDHQQYRYQYELLPKDQIKMPSGKKIAEWNEVSIGSVLPQKPDGYFTAIRRAINEPEVAPGKTQMVRYSKAPCETSFGIQVTLTVPGSNTSSHPASIMKPLLDGVICAFHGESGGTEKAIQKKFGPKAEKLLKPAGSWNILGSRDYLKENKNRFQWNPADDAKYLRFGWVIVKKGDVKQTGYTMSGSIYEYDDGRIKV